MIKLQTNLGAITIELFTDKAPKTCENFLAYVREGYYNGLIFHRVIKNFMIQGGGFQTDMTQKATNDTIENEANNKISNASGTIAMARTSNPHSASSQFFINTKDNHFLDHSSETPDGWGYCVFGKVVEGIDTVRAIENVETGTQSMHQDVPLTPVLIESVEEV